VRFFKQHSKRKEKFVMGRFQGVAQAIADRIRKGPVTAEELPSIMEETSGRECPSFNCYPGTGTPGCEYQAVFISLICKTYALGLGHLGFRKAIDLIIKHMFKYCPGFTREFLFITDSWDPELFFHSITLGVSSSQSSFSMSMP
jgi:hypothetical protein